jgi:hypothetical protein
MSSELELERVWQSRVNAAWQVYDERAREFRRLIAQSNGDSIRFSGGSELICQARRRESVALREYMRERIHAGLTYLHRSHSLRHGAGGAENITSATVRLLMCSDRLFTASFRGKRPQSCGRSMSGWRRRYSQWANRPRSHCPNHGRRNQSGTKSRREYEALPSEAVSGLVTGSPCDAAFSSLRSRQRYSMPALRRTGKLAADSMVSSSRLVASEPSSACRTSDT